MTAIGQRIEYTGSRLDDAWQRLMSNPRWHTAWTWGGPAIVMLVAILTRLVGLNHPHELVFDETYYVKDSYTLMNLGYEGSWPADANLSFNAGNTAIYSDAPSFVAHPPIGKWIIAIGLALFGAGDSFGWRISVAVCGILLVLVTMLLAKRLFRSTLLAVIAGGLLAIDGEAIVMSRVALLDTMLALFALVGAFAILLDYQGNARRLSEWMSWNDPTTTRYQWGPAFWARPWLLVGGMSFGLASGVKWSGLYFLAVFAVAALGSEIIARHRAGIPFWLGGTIVKQGPITFLLTVPVALGVYVASWAGWFATSGGYYRQWIETGGGTAWTGLLSWVPYDWQNWWHYQASMYGYHVNEHTPHSYQANPLTWLFLVRPTSMYWHANGNDAETILGLANPLIWWAATAAVFFLVFRLVRTLVRWVRAVPLGDSGSAGVSIGRDAFILLGFAAGYLPWLLYLGRTVFQFYTIAFEPFMVLALTAAIATLLGRASDPEPRRVAGLRVVGVFLVVCVVFSAFFLPIWTGMEIPRWYMTMHFWFPSWV